MKTEKKRGKKTIGTIQFPYGSGLTILNYKVRRDKEKNKRRKMKGKDERNTVNSLSVPGLQ